MKFVDQKDLSVIFLLCYSLKEAEKEMNALKDARDEKDKENNLLLSS